MEQWFNTSNQLWKEMTLTLLMQQQSGVVQRLVSLQITSDSWIGLWIHSLELWQRMFTDFEEQFHNILMLVEIIHVLILPLATANVERGFSAMKRVKNDWRSCIETDILNILLRITINGYSLDTFDPQGAVQHWWTSGERVCRPDFQKRN